MNRYLKFIFPAIVLLSCSKNGTLALQGGTDDDRPVAHEMIVLGSRLENPYKTDNVRKAYTSLYPTKSRDDIVTTDLYVRFLPESEEDYDMLENLGVRMLDHPMDYSIVREGDYYHDPEIDEDSITWQYAVVPVGFDFPDIRYELISECFLSENTSATKAMADVDWEAVEMEAFRLTGNETMMPQTATKAAKVRPSGRITIVDDKANGGKPFGVAGVKVSCNVFVKFADAYTDRDGYYSMSKSFSAKPRYRIVFKNTKGFGIGFNWILVPASVSTLGKAGPEGISCTIDRYSESKLFKRSVVNNAVYEYIDRCGAADMNILPPPANLRLWLFNGLNASSAVMMHHGTVVENKYISKYLGIFSSVITFFSPDITIGTKDGDDYQTLYDKVCHELAHASHFAKAGKAYWNDYIEYIARSYLASGGDTYGSGTEDHAGHCEVGEMWAYYVESLMHKERYGGGVPTYGTSYWFFPQVFRYLDARGMSRSEIFAALGADVSGRKQLQDRLTDLYPGRKVMIEQAFNRYR